MKRETCIRRVGVGAFQNIDTVRCVDDRATNLVFDMKRCSRLLIVFCRKLCEKRQIWYLNLIFEKLAVTYDLG